MTETFWITCTVGQRMWRFIAPRASHRKLRLAVCASVESASDAERKLLELAQDFADGIEFPSGLGKDVREELDGLIEESDAVSDQVTATKYRRLRFAFAETLPETPNTTVQLNRFRFELSSRNVELNSPDLLRDIFGNPFRPVTLDPRWLSSTVLDLARTIYDERVFERMPILGDALMDAGCDSDEIIQHCQGPGPHVRGCWVVDLVLGKS